MIRPPHILSCILSKCFILAACLCLGSLAAAESPADDPVQVPPENEILKTLKPEHPRLLADLDDFVRIKQLTETDPIARRWYENLQSQGEEIVRAEPSRYEIPDGKRLLATSRRVLDRVYTLALLYHLQGDRRYADRAWRELEAAADFQDWNPSHFLDTAEMTHAFAIGYDWLYDAWTPEQRDRLVEAMLEKGFVPAEKSYAGEATYGWWKTSQHNWNQVCNGGILIGALAIAEREPERAARLVHAAVESLPRAMRHFAPDGAWAEGPGYWGYATQYNVAALAALDSALGTDFGLSQIEGFSEAGRFPPAMCGPTDLMFNYADASAGKCREPQIFWFARRFDQPELAGYQIAAARPETLDLVWYDPNWATRRAEDAAPLDVYFRVTEAASMRSAAGDPDALFVAVKAGSNAVNHSHLDIGSFVLDALGERWIVDPGSDDYNLPGYFGGQRWDYYRLRAEGHNTLVVNPSQQPDQSPRASTRITEFRGGEETPSAVLDITAAYEPLMRSAVREISLPDRREVLLCDRIEAAEPVELWSFLHTPAEVTLSDDGREATLRLRGKQLRVMLEKPANARLEILPAEPLSTSPHPPKQADNRRLRKLGIHLRDVTESEIQIRFVPMR